jgi:1-acyl-sn-glycerol-3-phosphate acyltransferase
MVAEQKSPNHEKAIDPQHGDKDTPIESSQADEISEEKREMSQLNEIVSEQVIDEQEVKRQELITELDALVVRVQDVTGYYAPPFSRERLVYLVRKSFDQYSPSGGASLIQKISRMIHEDILNIETWKGVWYVINYIVDSQLGFIKRRMRGEYETDEWGFDPGFVQAVTPFIEFMYDTYWRVETTGIENVPEEGRAMLVSNHSGVLPWDSVMIAAAVYKEHPSQRLVRNLFATWFVSLPFLSALFVKLGQTLANEDNGIRLLEQEQLIAVYPEGTKGVGKLFKDRYRLARFGRGGFVRMAIKTGAMMIPVSVVGAEEIYISIAKSQFIADLIKFPFFPISLRWPLLGPLAFIPFPTKWYIDFGEPIPTDHYENDSENNLALVSELSDQVRNIIQEMLYKRLSKRKSIFLG